MIALVGLLAFYFVVSAIIESAIKGLERITWSSVRSKFKNKTEFNSKVWSIASKWLMLVLSFIVVGKIGIFFIQTLAIHTLHMPEDFSIGLWDLILTSLLISRGSNVVHDLLMTVRAKAVGHTLALEERND